MRRLGLMMLLVAAMHVAASAQETTGTITGVTTDQTGAVLPGVTVTVKNTNTGAVRAVVTNEAGIYTASLLPVGAYEVTFELQGFQPVTLRDIALHVNDRLQIDGRMAVGGLAESVVVAVNPTGTKNKQSDYGVSLSDFFPGNAAGVVPFITVTGMSQVGANQLITIAYNNYTVTDNFTWQRGTHSLRPAA